MKESTIERLVCKYAKDNGCIVMKLAGPNQKGQPDRMFLKSGKVLFIEFKAPGKKPTSLQMKFIKDLWMENFNSFTCDDIQKGKEMIDTFLL